MDDSDPTLDASPVKMRKRRPREVPAVDVPVPDNEEGLEDTPLKSLPTKNRGAACS